MIQFFKKTPAVFICFCLLTGLIFAFSNQLLAKGISLQVLLMANVFFFLITLLTAFMQIRSLSNKNPNVFIRAVMGGMFIKMMVTAFALILYFIAAGKSFDTKAIFISLFFYLFYLAAEVLSMVKLNKSGHA